jgi:hypothetical protein
MFTLSPTVFRVFFVNAGWWILYIIVSTGGGIYLIVSTGGGIYLIVSTCGGNYR